VRIESGAMRPQWNAGLDRVRSSVTFWADRLLTFLAAAALVEFLSLRLLIRLGPVLPRAEITVTVTETMIFIGAAALNFALLLALAALTTMAWQTSRYPLKYCLAAIVILTIGLALAGSDPPPLLFVAFLFLSLSIIGIALWFARHPKLYAGWLALFGGAYLALAYPTLVNTLHVTLPFTAHARAISELLILLSTLGAPFILRPRRDWIAVIVGMTGAILLAGLWFSVEWLPPTLMIWSVAFTGYLPAPVYTLALGLWLYTFTALMKTEGRRYHALGLALVALGGLRWDLSYYVLLALTGFLLLSGANDEPPQT
jgi:hypothetical protein